MKVEYRIEGVPSRMDNIKLLWEQLGIGEKDTFLDTEYRQNPVWTWKQTVQLPMDGDTTHICIVQDDAILPLHFKEFVEKIAKKYPNNIIKLYNNKDLDSLLPKGCIFTPNRNLGGVSTLIPSKYIDSMVKQHEEICSDYIHDDAYISFWAFHNNVEVYNTYPSIVDTLEGSELGHPTCKVHFFCEDTQKYHWCDARKVELYPKYDKSQEKKFLWL